MMSRFVFRGSDLCLVLLDLGVIIDVIFNKKVFKMTKVELETEIVQKIHYLPVETLEKIFIFITEQSDKKQIKQRKIGVLEGKANCVIHDDFKITDEEFLQL